MTYAAYTAGQESGSPVQLYLFRYGTETSQFYAYTDATLDEPDATIPMTHPILGAIEFTPIPIDRDAVNSNGTLDKSALRIRSDIGTAVAELFRVYPPASVVSLVIWEGHLEDPDEEFVVVWAGRIVAAQREGSELIMTGEPVSTSLRRPGLRRHYQYGCPHQLYGPQCQADKPSKTVASTVESITGATVTLATGWEGAFAQEKFLGGMLEWETSAGSTDRRTILRVTGDVLSLSGVPQGLSATDDVDVVLGCNHQAFSPTGDCEAIHDNLVNFGGQPWIPTKNPIGQYNNYY